MINTKPKKKKIVGILQARFSSTRLPGKILKSIGSKTLLEIVIDRVSRAKRLNGVVVATTLEESDNITCKWLEKNNQKYFRGDSFDVLSRFWHCAKIHNADLIVRLTADDPFKDPELIDQCIETFLTNERLDYLSNAIVPSYPEGLDVEVFTFDALNRAYCEAKLPSEREHVTPYIWKNNTLFKILSVQCDANYSHYRWTVDHPEDLLFVTKVFERCGFNYKIGYKEILKLLNNEPELIKINDKIIIKEGYLISLNNDKYF